MEINPKVTKDKDSFNIAISEKELKKAIKGYGTDLVVRFVGKQLMNILKTHCREVTAKIPKATANRPEVKKKEEGKKK